MDDKYTRTENEIFSIIKDELYKAKLSYVENLGYRVFLRNGDSIGICTNETWKEEKAKTGFTDMISKFYSNELLMLKRENRTSSIRVQGQSYCEFLQVTSKYGFGNVLVVHRFLSDKIVAYYFVAGENEHNTATKFYNDKYIFENIVTNCQNKVESISARYGLADNARSLIPMHVLMELFPNRSHRLVLDIDQKVIFTEKQKEIILLLASGCTGGKEIARVLQIEPRTAYDHFRKLKTKLHLTTKTELISCAKKIAIGFNCSIEPINILYG